MRWDTFLFLRIAHLEITTDDTDRPESVMFSNRWRNAVKLGSKICVDHRKSTMLKTWSHVFLPERVLNAFGMSTH